MKDVFVRLALLLLAVTVCWCFFYHDTGNPPTIVDKLVTELGCDEPWHYRLFKRTNTLRFLPKNWQPGADYEFRISARRWRAVMELGKLGTNAWPAVPALVAMVTHKNLEFAVLAAQALAVVRAEQHPGWDRWRSDLKNQNSAAQAFHWLLAHKNGQPYDFEQRRFALIGLTATGPAAVVAHRNVIDLVKFDQEAELREWAVMTLGAMNATTNTVPLLQGVLQNQDEWPNVSAAAVHALAGAVPRDPETRRLLQQALQDRRSAVRLAAARALWKLNAPPEEVLPVMTALLQHKLVTVRTGALDGISEMGSAAEQSRPFVEQLLSDENESVRRSARAALKRFNDDHDSSIRATRSHLSN